jgi:hypothetical protein
VRRLPGRLAVSLVAAATALVIGGAALATNTPYPPPSGGSGTETTGGSGSGEGLTITPKYAYATYDTVLGKYVIYLTAKPVSCTETYYAKPPYLAVYVITDGSPLVVGKPSLQKGDKDFVQVDFFVEPKHPTYYTLVQPGVQLVLTHVSTAKNALWHGRLTVPLTLYGGKTYQFSGTFAARWCGKTG